MDSARQVIRWALPGWIMALFYAFFIMVGIALHGNGQNIYKDFLKIIYDNLLILGVVSIPIGFILYQLYHWAYWFIPFPALWKLKLYNPKDRGREILSGTEHLDFNAIFGQTLYSAPSSAYKKWWFFYHKSTDIMTRYRQNWNLADSAWYLALANEKYKNVNDFLERRNQFLGDIYHSLGACQIAILLSYFTYILTALFVLFKETTVITTFSLSMIVCRIASFLINTLAFFLLYAIFQKGRLASFDALYSLKHDVITNALLDKPKRQKELRRKVNSS
jgi:hypothetical protein